MVAVLERERFACADCKRDVDIKLGVGITCDAGCRHSICGACLQQRLRQPADFRCPETSKVRRAFLAEEGGNIRPI